MDAKVAAKAKRYAAHHDTSVSQMVQRYLDLVGAPARSQEDDPPVLRRALSLGWPDFEDAVCAAAAESCGCDAIVTRDPKGFVESPVRVVDCPAALAWLTGA